MLIELLVTFVIISSLIILIRKILPKNLISTDGKAVLITGCDSGFGNRLALRLNQIGFKVYATVYDTNSPGALQLKESAVFGHKLVVLKMDVTIDGEVNETLEKVKRDLSSSGEILWALVNNAGLITTGLLDWGTIDSYYKLFEVNVFGTVRTTRAFLPLIKYSKGRIININSFNSRFSFHRIGIYCMTKHSLIAFTDTLRTELYGYGVKVLSIEPGNFNTNIFSMENFIEQLDINWSQSSDEVKRFYGSNEGQKKCLTKLWDLFARVENIDIAVDDMIDSIMNCRPKLTYRPMGLPLKIFSLYLMFCPTELIVWLANATDQWVLAS